LYRKEDIKRINGTFATTHSKYIRTNNIEGAPTRNVGVQTDDHISTGSKVLFIAIDRFCVTLY
jgi:hypothetical protein